MKMFKNLLAVTLLVSAVSLNASEKEKEEAKKPNAAWAYVCTKTSSVKSFVSSWTWKAIPVKNTAEDTKKAKPYLNANNEPCVEAEAAQSKLTYGKRFLSLSTLAALVSGAGYLAYDKKFNKKAEEVVVEETTEASTEEVQKETA